MRIEWPHKPFQLRSPWGAICRHYPLCARYVAERLRPLSHFRRATAEEVGLKDYRLEQARSSRVPSPFGVRPPVTSAIRISQGQRDRYAACPHWHQGNYQFYVRRVQHEIAHRCSSTKQGAARLGLCVTSAQPLKTIEPVDIVLEVESVRNKKKVSTSQGASNWR